MLAIRSLFLIAAEERVARAFSSSSNPISRVLLQVLSTPKLADGDVATPGCTHHSGLFLVCHPPHLTHGIPILSSCPGYQSWRGYILWRYPMLWRLVCDRHPPVLPFAARQSCTRPQQQYNYNGSCSKVVQPNQLRATTGSHTTPTARTS